MPEPHFHGAYVKEGAYTIKLDQSDAGGTIRLEVDRHDGTTPSIVRHQLYRPGLIHTVERSLTRFGVDTTDTQVSQILNELDDFALEQRNAWYPPDSDDEDELPSAFVVPNPTELRVAALKTAYDIVSTLADSDVVLHTQLLDEAQKAAETIRRLINYLRANEFFGDTDTKDGLG